MRDSVCLLLLSARQNRPRLLHSYYPVVLTRWPLFASVYGRDTAHTYRNIRKNLLIVLINIASCHCFILYHNPKITSCTIRIQDCSSNVIMIIIQRWICCKSLYNIIIVFYEIIHSSFQSLFSLFLFLLLLFPILIYIIFIFTLSRLLF